MKSGNRVILFQPNRYIWRFFFSSTRLRNEPKGGGGMLTERKALGESEAVRGSDMRKIFDVLDSGDSVLGVQLESSLSLNFILCIFIEIYR